MPLRAQIKSLQEQSFTMSIKLRNRKAAEAQLGQFVEDISLPPKLISAIVDGEVRGGGASASTGSELTGMRTCTAGERRVRAKPCATAHKARVHGL